ncbi:MAG: NADH-quinone oxidoreductase subunit NuoN [Pseudomonadota bacterium]|nr:NADH-quinone oxidoreductase subunit NuoN [Pseudomonadota bacterium]MDE3038170.1 NADH-quinone oxidoreductase subunit NuoN [Pseudomonadota bacterium]
MLSLRLLLPELYLGVMALFLLMTAVLFCKRACNAMLFGALFTLFGTAFFLWPRLDAQALIIFNGMFASSGFIVFAQLLILAAAALSILLAAGWLKEGEWQPACAEADPGDEMEFSEKSSVRLRAGRPSEFLVLVLLAVLGMVLMVAANDLLTLYLALEMSSLSLYVLAAFARDDAKSSEAGLKYFVLGALASGMLLFGMSLIYGFAGTTGFAPLSMLFAAHAASKGIIVGMVLIIIGFCFKISAAPFHMWAPDVYEGAPTPVTAFFAAAPKAAALALFTRVMLGPFDPLVGQWQQVVIFISIASMAVGALAAIMQTNIKRLLAYSSIGHAGFMLMGLAAGNTGGAQALLIYLVLYVFMSAGAFGCVLLMKRGGHYTEDIRDLAGLGHTHPVRAAVLAAFMFSLAGIPPLAGFFGKLYVVLAAVSAHLVWLAVIGVITSVVSGYYYIKVVKIMYFDDPREPFDAPSSRLLVIGIGIAAVVTLLFFLWPTPLVAQAKIAAGALLH